MREEKRDRKEKPSKWDLRFLDMARNIACWSKDPSTCVGAVIADKAKRIVSVGYNGLPRAVPDDQDILCDRKKRLLATIHAEINAILFARCNLAGTTMYTTRHPCAGCAAVIVQSGITRVVWIEDTAFEKRWEESMEMARWLFERSGVDTMSVPFVDVL